MTSRQLPGRARRRLLATVAGWVILGAATAGVAACSAANAETSIQSSADVAGGTTADASSAATTPAASTPAGSASAVTEPSTATAGTSTAGPSAAAASPAGATPTEAIAAGTSPASGYADGTYTATGSYSTPGGTESITVTLTLADGAVTAVEAEGGATRPPSSQFQDAFESGVAAVAVGVDIAELNLDAVAGSSLTPQGFNDAVEQIRADAQA